MQADRQGFLTKAASAMRPTSQRVLMSFDKQINDDTTFFTIGQSFVGGPDIIRGDGSVVQEWDKYDYTDYSDRVIAIEWSRTEEVPYSVTQAIADVTLDNHDDFFTPSDISPVLPRRPIKIFSGFDTVDYPVFIGMTESLPEVDEKNKTVKFHCIDFLSFIFEKPLTEAVIYQDENVGFVISDLLETQTGLAGLQLDIDLGFNDIPFAFFDKDMKLGDALRLLVQSDLGSLFLNEEGVIRFKNRQNYDDTSIFTFDNSNIVDLNYRKVDNIVNVIEVKSNIRIVQPNQKIWELSTAVLVPDGEQVDVWADFSDPVTGVDTPIYEAPVTDSRFTDAFEETGEPTPYNGIALLSVDRFSKSYKMTFENLGGSDAYIRYIQLVGTPAKVTKQIYIREQDDDSVAKYDEHVMTIENDYIQDESTATSLALTMLSFYAEPSTISDMEVKGFSSLQLGDTVTTEVSKGIRDIVRPVGTLMAITKTAESESIDERDYAISKIECRHAEGEFYQRLTVRPRITLTYFVIGQSFVGSADVIAP